MMSELLSHGERSHSDRSTHLFGAKVQTNISLHLNKPCCFGLNQGKLISSLCQAGEIEQTFKPQTSKKTSTSADPALEPKQVLYCCGIKTSDFSLISIKRICSMCEITLEKNSKTHFSVLKKEWKACLLKSHFEYRPKSCCWGGQ